MIYKIPIKGSPKEVELDSVELLVVNVLTRQYQDGIDVNVLCNKLSEQLRGVLRETSRRSISREEFEELVCNIPQEFVLVAGDGGFRLFVVPMIDKPIDPKKLPLAK